VNILTINISTNECT